MSKILFNEGVKRETRGKTCYELPNPVIIKITNPTARIVTLSQRKWNYALPFAESLWLATGRNDLSLVEKYASILKTFSDDGITMRAGYGPRLRHYNGISEDYKIDSFRKQEINKDSQIIEVDQFDFITKLFKKDPFTRQGIITISDPPKDCFTVDDELKVTKDFPCTKGLHFQRNEDKLDLIVHMRSNDFLWGASAVNIFNYTFIQEYFSQILGLKIGTYYHIVDNLHYYDDKREMVIAIKDLPEPKEEAFVYNKSFSTLDEFDDKLKVLSKYEEDVRLGRTKKINDFKDDFFNDWAKIFYAKNCSESGLFDFVNPSLNKIIDEKRRNERGDMLKKATTQNKTDEIKNIKQ